SQECWCVDSEGQEVTGTRTNNSIPHCPTPCQLQSLLQCAPSGLFEPVQCDSRGRCWCVDQDGMELYGTRQASIPRRCPSSCEVRSRRLLHSSASSPPQCAADGSFLPVQCKFINTTDRTELDLLLAFSSSPEAFETFRNFRKFFPLVSSYCFCSDSRGRELQGTGVELLMSEVYDSAFSGPRSAHSFAQTNIYRVLQRRMLGVRLALSGHFRCPSPCEEERRAALESSSVFVPSCEADGRFSAKQCQQGALCWCVDPTGRELTGTRRPGDGLVCGEDELHHLVGCCSRSKRRTDSPLTPPPGSGPVLQGLFPSVGGALEALTRSPAQRLQENLFGGKFLQNVAAFNYTGVLGPRGAVGVDQLSAQSLQENRDLVRAVSRALEDPAFLLISSFLSSLMLCYLLIVDINDDSSSLFVPRCSLSGGYQPVQCRDAECWCVNLQGQEAPGSRTAGWPPRCPTSCEMARANAMKVKSNMAAGAEIHIPACSEDGDFLPLQCVGDRCFCVDAEGRKMAAGPTGGAVTCEACLFTMKEHDITDDIIGSSSALLMLLPPHRLSYQLFTPQCDAAGNWRLTQCYHSTGHTHTQRSHTPRGHTHTPRGHTHTPRGAVCCLRCIQGGSVNSVLPSGPSWCELQRLRCRPDGSFDPLQCDVTSCWCVSEDGQEMAGTRSLRQTGRTPSCDRPLCPAPNITHGALVCHPAADGRQSCDLVCHHGYQNSLPVSSFLCSIKSRQWDEGDKPLSGACQSESVRFYFVLFIFLLPSGRSVALCGDSAVGLWCDAGDSVRLTLRWTADLSDLTTSDLPHLHHMGEYSLNRDSNFSFSVTKLRRFVPAGLRPAQAHGSIVSFPVVCPAGSFYQQGVCLLCPQGTYQELEGRDFCTRCPRGSSPAGASAANQCETDCERRGLRCSQSGDFLLAQPNFLSGGWRCVSNEGVELEWTSREERLTDEECSGEAARQPIRAQLSEDQFGPGSGLGCERPVFVSACAVEPSCHHVALFDRRTRCDLYSSLNAVCSASQQVSRLRVKGQPFRARILLQLCVFLQATGFLGNPRAVSGVFRTQVFSSRNTSLSDVRRFCQDGCSRDACCHGFILNQNVLDGGSLLCGWLRAPSVLMCEDEDWDVIGQGPANRICGAGLSYSKQQRSFEFDFGGEKFTISKKATQLGLTSPVQTQTECSGSVQLTALSTVQLRFQSLSSAEVLVDPQRKQPVLSFWLSKNDYSSQNALLWCLTRCDEEEWCSVTDLGESESDRFFRCALYPDTRVCGGYDQPIRRSCRPLLDRATNNTYSKKGEDEALGSEAVSVSRFRECERRCDEDPCCRGFGFVHETKSRGLLCLPLISLGVLTCSEDDASTWRTQDCSPPEAETSPEPFGWYQKPVNQWTTSPPESVSVFMDDWRLLSESSLLIDASLSTYDVIHRSEVKLMKACFLSACQEAESCVAVSLRKVESAVRCILYPDTTTCGLSSAPDSLSPASSCRLVVKEPAPQVYLRAERSPQAASISVPGHGTLQGVAMETAVGSDRRTVIRFLGVPYARPPIGVLRFEAAQLADWTGTWDATKPRPSCVQPGDDEDSASSEDCLYLNIFTPARGRVPVLVYFFNPPANQNQNLLDGSALAALGNIVVVTASYRTAALGFLTAGGLHGNYGLSDQEAALRWVHAHISLVGGDSGSVTVGAERRGADISSLTLLSSSPPFHRMILMGGSVFSPSLVQTASAGRRQAVDLARELGCVTSDLSDDGPMVACLRSTPVHKLNAAQTKLLAVSGPFQAWAPVRRSESESFHRVDLMLGTSEHDGLISRARRIKDFEALQGRGDRKTAFYEALSRSLGGASGNALLKDAAAWFYSLDHDPSAAGYNLFSRALNNATRDLFIICPTVQMALHWAASGTNIFQYHQPASSAQDRADVLVPLDVQFLFGIPLQPMNSQRFTSSDRRLSLAVMTYASSFIRTGSGPHLGRSVLPRWQPVTAEAPPTYLELSPALQHQQGLRQNACSFWRELGTRLTSKTGRFCDLGAEPVQIPELPLAAPSSQSQTNKDAYN
uniref:Thyroglobulin n=1 Tax=Poecilia latipinna TaxID=48699 RepID=A0A3B3U9M5_9TELE